MSIEQEVQQGWHDAIIELFEIDLSAITGSSADKFYFTANLMPDNSKIRWKGKTYEPLPMEAAGFEKSTKGQLPQPELTVANVLGTLASVVNSFDDLVGAKVTRRRTLMKYLDTGSAPDASQEFPDDIFYIERKTAETNVSITWQLASKIDLEGLQLPKRIITQNYCIWRYKGAECGYSGPPVADQFDKPLSAGGGTSPEGQAYVNALNAYNAAVADKNTKEVKKNKLQEEATAACDPNTAKSDGSFFVFDTSTSIDYTFYIQDGDGNNVLGLSDGQRIDPEADPPTYRPGFRTRTDRGPGNDDNGTGPVYFVNTWATVSGATVVVSSQYDPANGTLALYDLDNEPVLIVNGSTVPRRQFSQPGYDIGSQASNGFAPMRRVERIKYGDSDCTEAQAAYQAALQAYDTAVAVVNQRQQEVNAALAALPVNDALLAQDQCGKRLQSCKLRFGATGSLPFGGFPGANLVR